MPTTQFLSRRKLLVAGLAGALLTGAGAVGLVALGGKQSRLPRRVRTGGRMSEFPMSETARQVLIDRLTASGWVEATAQAVVEFNNEWFCLLQNEAPERLDE